MNNILENQPIIYWKVELYIKKVLIIILILISIILLNRNNDISNDIIRFRVIANSNSSKDILIKEKIVSEISDLIFVDNKSIEEARKNINNSIPAIELKIE